VAVSVVITIDQLWNGGSPGPETSFLPSNSSLSARGTLDTRLPLLHTHCTLSTTLVVHATAACKTQRLARLSSPPTPTTHTPRHSPLKSKQTKHAHRPTRRRCIYEDIVRLSTARVPIHREKKEEETVSVLCPHCPVRCACQTPLTTPFATYPDTVSVCAPTAKPTARNRPKKRGARRCVSL